MATTAKDAVGMFGRLNRAAMAAGVDVKGWQIEQGSVTYGRSWKLHYLDPSNGGHCSIKGMDPNLGRNAREAYLSLYGMVRAFELVAS